MFSLRSLVTTPLPTSQSLRAATCEVMRGDASTRQEQQLPTLCSHFLLTPKSRARFSQRAWRPGSTPPHVPLTVPWLASDGQCAEAFSHASGERLPGSMSALPLPDMREEKEKRKRKRKRIERPQCVTRCTVLPGPGMLPGRLVGAPGGTSHTRHTG